MSSATENHTGGCQCGAVRFRIRDLGRASLCHCRMCQKASAGIGGLLVTAGVLEWTRGAPKHFASSNAARRGFCGACGTPLTFENAHGTDVSIVALDRAAQVAPVIQLAVESRLPWFDDLHRLPTRTAQDNAAAQARYAEIASNQHPDHETSDWPIRP